MDESTVVRLWLLSIDLYIVDKHTLLHQLNRSKLNIENEPRRIIHRSS